MNLAQIQADVYRRLNYQTTPAPEVVAAILAFINETHEEILSRNGYGVFTRASTQVVTTADRWQYAAPQAVGRISSVTDSANQWRLSEMSLDTYRSINPDPSAVTGTPTHYVYLEDGPVSRQPTASTAAKVYCECSSASDTTQTLYVEYLTYGGDLNTTAYALVGTSAIAQISSDTIIQITDCYLSAACAGSVILRLGSTSGTILVTINAGEVRGSYKQILFFPTPASQLYYDVEFERELTPLLNATDEPVIPDRFHRLLSIGARKKRYEQTGDAMRLAVTQREWQEGLALLNEYVVGTDRVFVPGNGSLPQTSILPAWYPATSYRGRW